jgi:hypothetical protein
MNETVTSDNPGEPDLIDRIASALPDEVRSDYYRELMHCRSLPENDEMLRLLRAMQFLTLLMIQVPADVTGERERLECLFRSVMQKVQDNLNAWMSYQKLLDERLICLPDQIKKGINPDIITAKINESLRQKFIESTIPETAHALALVAENMNKTTGDFASTAIALTNSYDGAAEKARQVIGSIESSISRAAAEARRAATSLAQTFHSVYWWVLTAVAVFLFVMGFASGMIFQERMTRPPQQSTAIHQTVTQSPNPIHHSKKKP